MAGIKQKRAAKTAKLALRGEQSEMADREHDGAEGLIKRIRLFRASAPDSQECSQRKGKENPWPSMAQDGEPAQIAIATIPMAEFPI
jgi:hypothetical protein